MSNEGNELLVYISGSAWDDVSGTDKHLASALAEHTPILWVEPPVSVRTGLIHSREELLRLVTGRLDSVAPNVLRLRILGPPALTRPLVRLATAVWFRRQTKRMLALIEARVSAVVVASPYGTFPLVPGARRVYFVTDDWSSGARMMGLSRNRINRMMSVNARQADIVATVSPGLRAKVDDFVPKDKDGVRQILLPNGCFDVRGSAFNSTRPRDAPEGAYAILVGQLNERIDDRCVRAVADIGLPVVIVGPRTDKNRTASRRLDDLMNHRRVIWVGRKSSEELLAYLHFARVGLTPYKRNEFNYASFPLKTLEYLAAGLPVVSTDLPASHWLSSEHVSIANTASCFGELALRIATTDALFTDVAESKRQMFAGSHTWSSRATTLLEVVRSSA